MTSGLVETAATVFFVASGFTTGEGEALAVVLEVEPAVVLRCRPSSKPLSLRNKLTSL